MPASISTVDRRSIPSVAIIGNDAVLVAAPATPVQLSHACLRYGFSVAVPASWGDELVAGEALRQLASRTKGPVVMCVCPYARSRLLTPGPDLEPYLVSLVAPPVATARYLRAVYGEHGVHITYIGSCPSGADPVIDVRLTPAAFLAELSDRGIALSEQPLVFDSIVPPDRRRWCSVPGGVPSAEMLCSDTDTRTLVEIDRDDVSTDLVQHIITREHVLLDLAPSLGCACSGAIPNLAPLSARGAVAALEPPRAPGPVVDLTVVVPLDVPAVATTVAPVAGSPPAARDTDLLERRLDQLLGVQVNQPVEPALEAEFEAELDADLADLVAASRPAGETLGSPRSSLDAPPPAKIEPVVVMDAPADAASAVFDRRPEFGMTTTDVSHHDHQLAPGPSEPPRHSVRRRTPAATPSRYLGASVPKATGADGRPLPRAYVAKRRTPSMGIPTIAESRPDEPAQPIADDKHPFDAEVRLSLVADPEILAVTAEVSAEVRATAQSPGEVVAPTLDAAEFSAPRDESAVLTPEARDEPQAEMNETPQPQQSSQASPVPPAPPIRDPAVNPGSGGGTIAAADSTENSLRILMFAVLLAFAAVVLYTLRP